MKNALTRLFWIITQTTFILAAALLASKLNAASALTTRPSQSIDQLIAQLGSDNLQNRDAAQQKLAALGDQASEQLKNAAENSDDPEIRSRAAAVIAALKTQVVSESSLITLHANEMSAQDVFKSISEQTHSHITVSGVMVPIPGKPGRSVTLDVDQKPFWDVISEVCGQLNVCPSENYNVKNAMQLFPAWENWMVHAPHEIVGPYWISVAALTHARTMDLNGTDPAHDSFTGELLFFPEPRLMVTHISQFEVIEATDDAGHSLLPRALADRLAHPPMQRMHHMLDFKLTYPDQPGTKISILRGQVKVMVAEDFQQLRMEDVLGTAKMTSPVAGVDLQVHVVLHSGDYDVEMNCARQSMDEDRWAAFVNQMSDLSLQDSQGHALSVIRPFGPWSLTQGAAEDSFKGRGVFSTFAPGDVDHAHGPISGDPAVLVWNFPTSLKQVSVPVVFKDLPMP